jgi:hypothetical protein
MSASLSQIKDQIVEYIISHPNYAEPRPYDTVLELNDVTLESALQKHNLIRDDVIKIFPNGISDIYPHFWYLLDKFLENELVNVLSAQKQSNASELKSTLHKSIMTFFSICNRYKVHILHPKFQKVFSKSDPYKDYAETIYRNVSKLHGSLNKEKLVSAIKKILVHVFAEWQSDDSNDLYKTQERLHVEIDKNLQ